MVNHLPMFKKRSNSSRSKKRKVTHEESSEEEQQVHLLNKMQETIELTSSDESEGYAYIVAKNTLALANKRRTKQKLDHPTYEVTGEITNRKGETVPIRVLFDTGTASTICNFVEKNISK